MIKVAYDLDMTPRRSLPIIINVSQNDDLGRTLVFNLFSSTGTWTAPDSATATLEGGKPDGKFFSYNCTCSNGTVTAIIQQQMTAVSGKVVCKVKVQSGNKVIESAPIYMMVDAAGIPDGADMSKSDVNDAVAKATKKIVEQVAESIPSDYFALSNSVTELKSKKVDKPSAADDGKIPRAKEGGVEWVEVGQPTDVQTESAVTKWLDRHPEATTTVQDGSLTESKIHSGFLTYIKKDYVTPEMFGAKGDGIHDDSDAIEKALSSNKKIVMRSGATYKICRTIIPKLSTLNIDGQGSTIIADNSFTYIENICYGFIQLQNHKTNLKEFVIRNLNINITTNGILFGDRVLGDERSCPIFRLFYVETIIIDNCRWFITSNSGNRAVLWVDGNCTNNVYITNSEFINECAGNAGGIIAIRMKNDEKDMFSFMANCKLITDSCDELYSINNIGASNLYSIIDSCIMVNHGGFIKNTTKKTIIVATNHEGTGDLRLCINATKIEYDGPETTQLLGAFKLSSYNNAKQKATFNNCDILNPYGHSVEGALGNQGHPKHLSVSFRECNIVGGENSLSDVIDNIGNITLDNCDIIGESYISYFYPLDYTNHFVLKNSRVTLKNPQSILFVLYKKRHIIGIYQNLYSGDYQSISSAFDEDDPNAPNVDMQIIDNNVFLKQ